MSRTSGLRRALAGAAIAAVAAGCSGGVDPTPALPPATPTPTLATPAASGVVARLAVPQYGRFSWSADGAFLLIASQNGSTVYDRYGVEVSPFVGSVGWLDSSHVVGVDGKARSVLDAQGLGYAPNQWVVGSGRGAAMIVVAVPGCTGDPMVDWYRDGAYRRTNEKLTPIGFSFDGSLAIEGHLTCSSMDAELHGWKGVVDVIDLATGRAEISIPNVRGELAFAPGGKMLAAQSDGDLAIADLGSGHVTVVKNVRLLAWIDSQHLALAGNAAVIDAANPSAKLASVDGHYAVGDTGITLAITADGKVNGVDGPNGRVVDLASEGLSIDGNRAPGADEREETRLQPSYWSPDGRMLALPSADGSSIVLVSADPAHPAQPYASKPAPSN